MFETSTWSRFIMRPSHIELAAQQLIQESMADPWGDVSAAIYDTARVLLLPHSLQPKGSLDFLLRQQKADGSWGGLEAYNLVPSLAATATLLQLSLSAARGEEIAGNDTEISSAALHGLDFLATALHDITELPDLVAIELTLPALVEEIKDTLAALGDVIS